MKTNLEIIYLRFCSANAIRLVLYKDKKNTVSSVSNVSISGFGMYSYNSYLTSKIKKFFFPF